MSDPRYEKIKRIVNDVDPKGLIKIGAPDDEYHGEVMMIFTNWKEGLSVEELAQVVREIFIKQFGNSRQLDEKPNEEESAYYFQIARRLLE